MTQSPPRCIFCRAPLGNDHPRSVEHVIPRALGGWLTIDCVCKPSTTASGTQSTASWTRRSSWLSGARWGWRPAALEGSYVIRDLGREVRGLIEADGSVNALRRVWEADDRAEIIAETAEEARVQAERLNARRARAGQPPLQLARSCSSHHGRSTWPWIPSAGRPVGSSRLLAREAAKITVDYVAYLGGCGVALDPRLDALRACAIDSATDVRLRRKNIVPPGTRAIYLPHGQNIFGMSARRADVPSMDDLERLMPDPSSDQLLPAGVAKLEHIFHVLRVRRENGAGVIDVVLFNLFAVVRGRLRAAG